MGSKEIIILITLLIAGGLGLYHFQSSGDSNNAGQKNQIQTEINNDTIPAQQQPTISAQPDTHDTVDHDTASDDRVTPPPVGQDFAPGTALVRGAILSVGAGDRPDTIMLRVDEVMGYGPSTPPLPTGTELSLDIANFLKAEPDSRDEIQKDEEIRVVISSSRGMRTGGSDDKQRWTLVELQ